MKWSDDSGNAVVEFVAIGLIAQLLILGFLVKVGVDFRSHLAAESLARQTLRGVQLSGEQFGNALAFQTAEVFGIPPNEVKVVIQNGCDQGNFVLVTATVRGTNFAAKGFCL